MLVKVLLGRIFLPSFGFLLCCWLRFLKKSTFLCSIIFNFSFPLAADVLGRAGDVLSQSRPG